MVLIDEQLRGFVWIELMSLHRRLRPSNNLIHHQMIELLSVKPADDGKHKLVASFLKDGRSKTTRFGAQGYTDYLQSKDPERRARYLERHGRGNEHWDDPTSAGSLSRHLLWGPSTSLASNISAFTRKFHLWLAIIICDIKISVMIKPLIPVMSSASWYWTW